MLCHRVALRRLKHARIPFEDLFVVSKALLLPLLCYAVLVWGGGPRKIIRRAQVIQNDALRTRMGRRRSVSVADVYEENNLLRVEQIHRLKVAELAHKISSSRVSDDVSFPIDTTNSNRQSRRATVFGVPRDIKEFKYQLPRVWDSLPLEIRSLSFAKSFLRKVTQLL